MAKRFGDKVVVTGESTPNASQKFEVTLPDVEGGKLVHSKSSGDGWIDTDAKKDKIFNAIEQHID